MNRIVFPLIIIIFLCYLCSSSVTTQDIENNQDSLRVEVQSLFDETSDLLFAGTALSFDSAQSLLDYALDVLQQNFSSNDTLLAKLYNYMALYHYYANEDFDLSSKYVLKALDVLKESPGENHILALNSYNILISNCLEKHDLVQCELYCNKRFEILNNLDEPLTTEETEKKADAYNDRARLLIMQNRFDEAIDDFEHGLALITDEMKGGQRLRADLNGNIAWLLMEQGKLVEAENRFLEVLEMMKQAYHPKHNSVLQTYLVLTNLALGQGDYDRADSLMDIVLAFSEEIFGESDIMQSSIFQTKSDLLLKNGKPEEAVDYAMRAVDINRKYTGDYPTNRLMGNLENAGRVTIETGKWDMANEIFNELLIHKHNFLNTVFGYASESQKLNYLNKYPPIVNSLLRGSITSPDKKLHQTAFNMVLRGKGMAIDAIAAEHAAAICSSDPLLDSLIEERRNLCRKIANLYMSSGNRSKDNLPLMNELNASKNNVETELSLYCSGMKTNYNYNDVSVEMVASNLPKQSVLWEFIKYYKMDSSGYLAMVLTPDANITVVNLGNAFVIDSLIEKYHGLMSYALNANIGGKQEAAIGQYKEVAKKIYENIILPLEFSLQDKQLILVAPDGLLNLLPFETITKDGNSFLIEDYQFVYLTTGRDILSDKPDISSRDAFIIADPDYMADPKELPAFAMSESLTRFNFRGDWPASECLESMFSPLPLTRQEGLLVSDLLGRTGQYNIMYLESDQAREDALKNLNQSPNILHIATHGYFCQKSDSTQLSNPLLRSGLILAGANHTIGGMNDQEYTAEDGILTAMEVSGLNLIGTDLVILSACQTGMGDVRSGEGVFGLRRAFQHAGAKSVIMSMFAVPDESTSYFMERFYNNWLSGSSKATSLRNASLSIIKELREEKGFAQPLFWGGFILTGDPN